jgi:hypothetical protein
MYLPVQSFDIPAPQPRHVRFLELLSQIERHARISFRHIVCEHRRADCVAETVALSWKWFLALEARGKDVLPFVSVFANLAARAVRCGRRLCGQESARDVLSIVAQQRHHFVAGKLPPVSTLSENPLGEALIDNTQSAIPEQVHFRVDFPVWLSTLSARDRLIVKDMALGDQTLLLAQRYRVSPGRISQLRRQFNEGWRFFCGES